MEHAMKLFEPDFDNLKSGRKKREYRLKVLEYKIRNM